MLYDNDHPCTLSLSNHCVHSSPTSYCKAIFAVKIQFKIAAVAISCLLSVRLLPYHLSIFLFMIQAHDSYSSLVM
jgi:hypothetical protein